MSAFVARFPGRCAAECGEQIRQGDEVVYVDDRLVHLACEGLAIAGAVSRPREVCPECWLEKPCPCDDGGSAA